MANVRENPNKPNSTDFPRRYFHGDLIGSTQLRTDEAGSVVNPRPPGESAASSYAAFGDPGGRGATLEERSTVVRYTYAGGYGYESGLLGLAGTNEDYPPITLMHVGERWYQPGIGRFVQRDPIGIRGGVNVYLYCEAGPLSAVDSRGLTRDDDLIFQGEDRDKRRPPLPPPARPSDTPEPYIPGWQRVLSCVTSAIDIPLGDGRCIKANPIFAVLFGCTSECGRDDEIYRYPPVYEPWEEGCETCPD
jgi:RHS repeat-associated protein